MSFGVHVAIAFLFAVIIIGLLLLGKRNQIEGGEQPAADYIWEQKGCLRWRRKELVHCRDCEFLEVVDKYRICRHCDCFIDSINGFCAWGIRKGADE